MSYHNGWLVSSDFFFYFYIWVLNFILSFFIFSVEQCNELYFINNTASFFTYIYIYIYIMKKKRGSFKKWGPCFFYLKMVVWEGGLLASFFVFVFIFYFTSSSLFLGRPIRFTDMFFFWHPLPNGPLMRRRK